MIKDKKNLWYAAAAALLVAAGVGYGVGVAPEAVYDEYTPVAFREDVTTGAATTADMGDSVVSEASDSGVIGVQIDILNGELTEPVDINTASAEELQRLPGIGPSKASSIIAYREEHGAFTMIDDVMQVPGIKEGTFAKICDHITVGVADEDRTE